MSSSNPFAIPIGTSDPLNLCNGLPLFPVLGTQRAGVAASARNHKLFDRSATILITRLNVNAYGKYGFGVCGPAIAFLSPNVDVLRTNSAEDKGELSLTFNEGLLLTAGTFVGAYAGIGFNLNLQVLAPKPWYKVWSFAWRDALAGNLDITVDLLSTLVLLAQFLLSRSSKNLFKEDTRNRLAKALEGAGKVVKTFSLEDTAGSTSTVSPQVRAVPKLTLPINIVNFFPELKALNASLSKIGGELSVGPSIHLEFPVTFEFKSFTIEGGLAGGASKADYDALKYANDQVSASGPTRFDTGVKPSRVTTNVEYRTALALTLSLHCQISVSKFFSIGANTPSLDLTLLLTGVPERDRSTLPIKRSVSTSVENGCVLAPNMTLAFTGPNNSTRNFSTGQKLKATVTLPEFSSSNSATVDLVIEPRVPGFPTQLTIPANRNTASFDFTFPNQCMLTGNRNNPSETAPPSPLTPLQTYNVRAKLKSDSSNVCTDYELEVPLDISERFIRCQRNSGAVGTSPAWDSLAGATLNANPNLPPRGGHEVSSATVSLWFPFVNGEATPTVPVRFTLLDENRQPHSRSNVIIFGIGMALTSLKPSATGVFTLANRRGGASSLVAVRWISTGPHTGYSNRFYLVVDAGCQFGQTEFWFDVWNWS